MNNMSEYKHGGKVLLVLSVVSVVIATLDKLYDIAFLDMGADSWMLVGIVLGVWGIAVKQWKSNKET